MSKEQITNKANELKDKAKSLISEENKAKAKGFISSLFLALLQCSAGCIRFLNDKILPKLDSMIAQRQERTNNE